MGNPRPVVSKKYASTYTVFHHSILTIRNKPANEKHFYILLIVVTLVISNWFIMDNKNWKDQFC